MDMQPLVLMSAKDLVTEKLREEIYTGNLKPGQELVQEKISEQLGVSRMPVREALLLLENAGLVEIQKNKRAIVRAVTPEEVREHLEIRSILESHAAAKACRRAENFDALGELLAKFQDCPEDDVPHFRELNSQFHFEIWRLAQSPLLERLLKQLWYAVPSAYPLDPAGNFRRNLQEHTAILDALQRRDEEAVGRTLSAHINKTESIILSRLSAGEG